MRVAIETAAPSGEEPSRSGNEVGITRPCPIRELRIDREVRILVASAVGPRKRSVILITAIVERSFVEELRSDAAGERGEVIVAPEILVERSRGAHAAVRIQEVDRARSLLNPRVVTGVEPEAVAHDGSAESDTRLEIGEGVLPR